MQTWDEEVEKSLGEIKKIRFYLLVDGGALLLVNCGTFLLLDSGAFLFLDRVVLGVAHLGTEEVRRDQVVGEEEYLFVDGVAFLLIHRLVGCLTLVLVDSVADLWKD